MVLKPPKPFIYVVHLIMFNQVCCINLSVSDAKQLKWEMDRDRWLRGADKRSFKKKGQNRFKGGNKRGKAKQFKGKKGRR